MVWCICVPDSIQLISSSVQALCQCGPQTWAEKHLQPVQHRQSPIDIQTKKAKFDPTLNRNPLRWIYPKKTTELVNTGYCWKAHVPTGFSMLEGGPLNHRYQLEQFHCHWGEHNGIGSEHLVNGHSYAAELHFVHWNTKYGSFNEALKHGDGLAVLGVFFKIGKEHSELKKLVDLVSQVEFKDQMATFRERLDPATLLPANHSYWTYLGSLTTPPCNECVIWIVFKDPIEVSKEQMEAFRSMSCLDKDCCIPGQGRMTNNYRPPLPLGDRTVRCNHC